MPRTLKIPAAFMRGGTSKGLMFRAADLPLDQSSRDSIFISAMGSPDPSGRQLNGMGGGLSSLSKVCVIEPSRRDDADVDFTFGQVLLREPRVEYRANCGNMSSAVGPFAVDEGMIDADGQIATVRIFNTNTGKIVHSTFPARNGKAEYNGNFSIPGVAGSGARIKLDFLDCGGATTGALLPTGNASDRLPVGVAAAIDVSMVDAANACAFVRAADIGLTGTESLPELEAHSGALTLLAGIRIEAAIAMGLADSHDSARKIANIPFVACVFPAPGQLAGAGAIGIVTIATGQVHKVVPVTVALCAAVAARIPGTVVHEMAETIGDRREMTFRTPSGLLLEAAADVERQRDAWVARRGVIFRTARRLFDGNVYAEL